MKESPTSETGGGALNFLGRPSYQQALEAHPEHRTIDVKCRNRAEAVITYRVHEFFHASILTLRKLR